MKSDVNVIKTIAQSFYDCGFAICNNATSADESKPNIGYLRLGDIPDDIDEKRHPKIAQRIREAQEVIAKAKSNQAKGGSAKGKIAKTTRTPIQSKKRQERTMDESR